jgi:hypothetical protein
MEEPVDQLLRKKSKWTTILGFVVGSVFFALFWKQGFGLNVMLFISVLLIVGQVIKFVVKSKYYFNKWDWVLILYWVMSLGVVLNDSLSINFIASFFVIFTSPVILFLSIYPETITRFSYLNSVAIYIQQIFSPFAGLVDYFRGLFRIRTEKFISPNSMKILIGILISVPILCLLTFLLMTADEAFKDFVDKFIDAINYFIEEILNLESIWDLFVWFVMIVGSIFALIGLAFAKIKFPLKDNKYEEPVHGLDMIISSVVLSGINLLFVVFIIIQSSYLFFGAGDIGELGFTYSEYARKGYWELQLVTIIVGAILYTIIRWGRKHGKITTVVSKTNLILLLVNTLMILFSAMFRMWLYVDAYGLTLLRLYPFVFMIFEFLLFAFLIPSVISRKVFASFSYFSFMTFTVILSLLTLLSPEKLVYQTNYNRALDGKYFDADYHLTLSSDAWRDLVDNNQMSKDMDIGDFTSCIIVNKYSGMKEKYSWHEWNWGRSKTIEVIEKEILKGEDIEEFSKDCNKRVLKEIDRIEFEYSNYLENKEFDKIYKNLWVKTDQDYLKYLDGIRANFRVMGRDYFEKDYEDYPSHLFDHSRYGSQVSMSLKVQVIYPSDGFFSDGNCISDYLVLKLQNGNLRISSSSLLPLGADIELGNYRGMDESYYKTALEELRDGEIYRYDCNRNF